MWQYNRRNEEKFKFSGSTNGQIESLFKIEKKNFNFNLLNDR